MRLTLRTLLAYMDDILDPSDQEELGRKIEASPFATELIHRSRDAVRRLRLSAPEVLSGESGDLHDGDPNFDANTAAEYLDNTLSPDDVAEFERNCLEAGPNADMLLAEAASCHHILTLVLGEPAEVDADLRQRMYALVRHAAPQQIRIEPAHTAHAVAPQAAVAAPFVTEATMAPAVTLPPRPAVDPDEASVPDYLLEAARARRRSRRLVATLVVGALLGSGLTVLFWPTEPPKPSKEVAALATGNVESGELEIGEPDSPQGAATDAAAAAPGGAAPAWTPGAPATAPPTDATVPATDPATEGGVPSGATAAPPETPESTDVAADGTTEPVIPSTADAIPDVESSVPAELDPGAAAGAAAGAASVPPLPVPDAPVADAPIAETPAADATAGSPPPAPADDPSAGGDLLADAGTMPPPPDALPSTAGVPDEGAGAGDAGQPGVVGSSPEDPAAAPGAPAEPAEPAAPRTLGAYLGLNNDLLLRFDGAAGPQGAWLRLPPRSTFAAGDRVLTLPAFRTHVVLNPDVNAYLGGGTEIVLLPPGEAGGDINIALPYGQLILNSGPSGNRIAIVLGDQTRVITLGPSSSLAVEVRRLFTPGLDPVANPAPLEASWYLTSGKADWGDEPTAGLPAQSAEAPAAWTTTADGVDQPPQAFDKLPDWIDKEPTTALEAGARDAIAETVASGQPVNSALLELTSNTGLGRRMEVRALAARGGAFVGEFEPLVKALADPLERAKRSEQVGALRAAIARDPTNVERIHDAFALQRGQEAAADLTEMVVGFSPESIGTTKAQVQEGSMLRLINWLDDDDLTYRVLASSNLNEITGTMGLGGYRPEHTASQRRREIQFYLKRFEAGELLPRQQ